MSFAFSGQGITLSLASSNPQEPVWTAPRTADPEIPDTDFSMGMPVNDAFKIMLTVNYDDFPTDVTTIEYSDEPTWANPIVLDTMPASATDLTNVWTTNDSLPGFVRISNTSGVLINWVKGNKQVSTVG